MSDHSDHSSNDGCEDALEGISEALSEVDLPRWALLVVFLVLVYWGFKHFS